MVLAFFAKIGSFVLWYSIALFVVAAVATYGLYRQYRATRRRLGGFRASLEGNKKDRPGDADLHGLPLEFLDATRARLEKSKDHASWWSRINDGLIPYSGPRSRPGWFLGQAATDALTETVLIEETFNQRLARALPGLITSAGLLGTFIAILMGLLDLKVQPDNSIAGIGNLIENLAGKFLTSIVAIGLSILISLCELNWFRWLRDGQRELLDTVESLFPRLDQVVILRDLQDESRKQSVSLSNISSEVVDRFQSVFTTELLPAFAQNVRGELAPAIDGLRGSMDRVQEALSAIQQDKQESVVGEFRSLATGLESTLKTTLEQIGRDFRDSLSGSTTGEFDKASQALGASADVLRGLNESFSQMRDSLNAVVVEARKATSEQLATGSERAKSLNDLVEQLLVRLNESSVNSAERVQLLLTQSVEGLHRQMEDFSKQMAVAVAGATTAATAASHELIQSAESVSRQSQEDAEKLSRRLFATLERMEGIGDTLGAAQANVRQVLSESSGTLQAFERAGAELRATATTFAGSATTAREAQDGIRTIMSRASETVMQLGTVATRQHDTLERQMKAFAEVERVFEGLDQHLGGVLGEITDRLQQHNQAIQQNFEAILSRVNTEVPKVSNSLQAATEELSSQIADLTDVLERLRQIVRAAGK